MPRNLIGASSALAILALLAAFPGPSQAHEGSELCNVILDGDGEPVKESDADNIAHSGSAACADRAETAAAEPAQTAAAQPAEPTPVAAARVDPLTVYFDVNRDNLSAGAGAEVAAYADALMATSPAGVKVVGYTDTSGPADLNARLSEARANSVAAALIDAGVPSSMIARSASGEQDLAVSTADNTREANNRRVTITPRY
jgi:outer membrane protein OmpA-like peptidoglycan-associated protein